MNDFETEKLHEQVAYLRDLVRRLFEAAREADPDCECAACSAYYAAKAELERHNG